MQTKFKFWINNAMEQLAFMKQVQSTVEATGLSNDPLYFITKFVKLLI